MLTSLIIIAVLVSAGETSAKETFCNASCIKMCNGYFWSNLKLHFWHTSETGVVFFLCSIIDVFEFFRNHLPFQLVEHFELAFPAFSKVSALFVLEAVSWTFDLFRSEALENFCLVSFYLAFPCLGPKFWSVFFSHLIFLAIWFFFVLVMMMVSFRLQHVLQVIEGNLGYFFYFFRYFSIYLQLWPC